MRAVSKLADSGIQYSVNEACRETLNKYRVKLTPWTTWVFRTDPVKPQSISAPKIARNHRLLRKLGATDELKAPSQRGPDGRADKLHALRLPASVRATMRNRKGSIGGSPQRYPFSCRVAAIRVTARKPGQGAP